MVKFSNFPLNLIIHRETKCLFEISTIYVVVKIKTKMKNRDGFLQTTGYKNYVFFIGRRGNFDRELGWCWWNKSFNYEIDSPGKTKKFMVESFVTWFATL